MPNTKFAAKFQTCWMLPAGKDIKDILCPLCPSNTIDRKLLTTYPPQTFVSKSTTKIIWLWVTIEIYVEIDISVVFISLKLEKTKWYKQLYICNLNLINEIQTQDVPTLMHLIIGKLKQFFW